MWGLEGTPGTTRRRAKAGESGGARTPPLSPANRTRRAYIDQRPGFPWAPADVQHAVGRFGKGEAPTGEIVGVADAPASGAGRMADGPPAVAETCLRAPSTKEPAWPTPPQLDRPCLCAPVSRESRLGVGEHGGAGRACGGELTARSGHQRPPRPARRLPGCLLFGRYGRLGHVVWRVT